MRESPAPRSRAVDTKRPELFLTPAEECFVKDKRAGGVPDQAIAKMLNRPVTSLDLRIIVDVAHGDDRAPHHSRQTRRPREARPARRPAITITEAKLPDDSVEVLGGNAQGQVRSFIERLEQLQADKDAVTADMKAVFAEAKGAGFTPATMRKVIAFRRGDAAKRQREQTEFDLYLHAVQGDLFEGKAA